MSELLTYQTSTKCSMDICRNSLFKIIISVILILTGSTLVNIATNIWVSVAKTQFRTQGCAPYRSVTFCNSKLDSHISLIESLRKKQVVIGTEQDSIDQFSCVDHPNVVGCSFVGFAINTCFHTPRHICSRIAPCVGGNFSTP